MKGDEILVEGRDSIVSTANKKIEELSGQSKSIIRYMGGILYVYVYPYLLSGLATKSKDSRIYDPEWLRTTTTITYSLNEILPKYIPLNIPPTGPTAITLGKNAELIDFLTNIGKWCFVRDNKYIRKIRYKDYDILSINEDENYDIYRDYINKSSIDIEYLDFINNFYKYIFTHEKFINKLNGYLIKNYKFNLEDLRNATILLEKLVEDKEFIISKTHIHMVFTKNIRKRRAEKLLKALTFNKENNDLFKAPLIPMKNRRFFVAHWILRLHYHFASWIEPIIEKENISGMYRNLQGRYFEKTSYEAIRPNVDSIYKNIIFSVSEYPSIKSCLQKLGKKNKLETDIITSKNNKLFLISCKGGKKEIPKSSRLKLWAVFPYAEIKDKINDNLKNMREIGVESDCIKNMKEIHLEKSKKIEISKYNVIPVLLYAKIQPLYFKEIREAQKEKIEHPNVIITTPKRFIENILK